MLLKKQTVKIKETGEGIREPNGHNIILFQKDGEEGHPPVISVLDCLESVWSMESCQPDLSHEEPLDGLILTLLSQNTNDVNRDRAFHILKRDFPNWDLVVRTDLAKLRESIKVGGLSNVKSVRILSIVERLQEKFGKPTLMPLKTWKRQEIEGFLSTLPGIGTKTIACMLVFEFSIPAFPVDTHVARICSRLGFVGKGTKEVLIQQRMEELIPPSRYLGAHLNMIRHGRTICRARKPLCEKCPVRSYCPYFLLGDKVKGMR